MLGASGLFPILLNEDERMSSWMHLNIMIINVIMYQVLGIVLALDI